MTNKKEEKPICFECGEIIENKDDFVHHEGYSYCQDCFDNTHNQCERCEGYHHVDGDWYYVDDIEETWCESCASNYSSCCDSCSERLADRGFCEGCEYCYNCCECEEERPTFSNRLSMDSYKQFEKSKTYNMFKQKRFVGVEIETEITHQTNIERTKSFFIDEGFDQIVDARYDGSLTNGVEFVLIPMNGDDLHYTLKGLCRGLKENHYEIRKTCGLHIHFDARDLTEADIEKIYYVYHIFEDRLMEMVPESRRNNGYCRRFPDLISCGCPNFRKSQIDMGNSNIQRERYLNVNFTNYYQNKDKKTIEIRVHSGTLDYKKILNWIRINNNLIDWALNTDIKRIMSLKNRIRTFYNIMNDKKLQKYIDKRRNKFNHRLKRIPIKNIKEDIDKNIEFKRGIKNNKHDLFILDITPTEIYKLFGENSTFRLKRALCIRDGDSREHQTNKERFMGFVETLCFNYVNRYYCLGIRYESILTKNPYLWARQFISTMSQGRTSRSWASISNEDKELYRRLGDTPRNIEITREYKQIRSRFREIIGSNIVRQIINNQILTPELIEMIHKRYEELTENDNKGE